jgi:hypothetical protein
MGTYVGEVKVEVCVHFNVNIASDRSRGIRHTVVGLSSSKLMQEAIPLRPKTYGSASTFKGACIKAP